MGECLLALKTEDFLNELLRFCHQTGQNYSHLHNSATVSSILLNTYKSYYTTNSGFNQMFCTNTETLQQENYFKMSLQHC